MRRTLLVGAALLAGALRAGAAGTPAVVVVLALDTSGSIAPADAEKTRRLASDLLASLPPGSEAALLTFDDQSRLLVPRTDQPDKLKAALATIRPSGKYTALYDALYEASRYLHGVVGARRAIVLVTDGRDENSALNLEDGLGDARDSGIPIYTVGVGRSEERVLRRIAKLTGGEYAPIADASGVTLGSQILALPTPEPMATPAAAPTAPPSTLAETRPAEGAARGRTALGLVLIGGVAAAALLALVAFASRRAPAPAPTIAAVPAEPTDGLPIEESVSPTIVGRFDTSEEELEKTLTLTDKPMLVVEGGPLSGQVFLLSRETTTAVGRARANDVVLEDVAVSSQHCRIRQEAAYFVLHDLQSTNGTWVNEQKVSRYILKAGDVVRVGETQLRFQLERKRG